MLLDATPVLDNWDDNLAGQDGIVRHYVTHDEVIDSGLGSCRRISGGCGGDNFRINEDGPTAANSRVKRVLPIPSDDERFAYSLEETDNNTKQVPVAVG